MPCAFKACSSTKRNNICDDRRIDLASHHEDGPPDPVTFLPIAGQKCPKRLLCNAPHQALASVHYSGVRFQFSHPRVVWLPRFEKSRIGQLDSVDIRELRRIARPRQEYHHSPT
ncbi:MAG: hypothetical protein DME53_12840 [Verrucomicrobia bacterium]|nr:MAG: hypothetical protein DME53_12840 [Verrucomicrobiota bacterium]